MRKSQAKRPAGPNDPPGGATGRSYLYGEGVEDWEEVGDVGGCLPSRSPPGGRPARRVVVRGGVSRRSHQIGIQFERQSTYLDNSSPNNDSVLF